MSSTANAGVLLKQARREWTRAVEAARSESSGVSLPLIQRMEPLFVRISRLKATLSHRR